MFLFVFIRAALGRLWVCLYYIECVSRDSLHWTENITLAQLCELSLCTNYSRPVVCVPPFVRFHSYRQYVPVCLFYASPYDVRQLNRNSISIWNGLMKKTMWQHTATRKQEQKKRSKKTCKTTRDQNEHHLFMKARLLLLARPPQYVDGSGHRSVVSADNCRSLFNCNSQLICRLQFQLFNCIAHRIPFASAPLPNWMLLYANSFHSFKLHCLVRPNEIEMRLYHQQNHCCDWALPSAHIQHKYCNE